mgnify:CR=1 FL=1
MEKLRIIHEAYTANYNLLILNHKTIWVQANQAGVLYFYKQEALEEGKMFWWPLNKFSLFYLYTKCFPLLPPSPQGSNNGLLLQAREIVWFYIVYL